MASLCELERANTLRTDVEQINTQSINKNIEPLRLEKDISMYTADLQKLILHTTCILTGHVGL